MTKKPTSGLLRAVRLALHIPVAEIVEKARVNRSGIYDFEASEMRHTITLKSMARIADAMGCKVVYGIVPKGGKTLERLADERLWVSVRGEGNAVDSEQ
jgi:transcriptional regulator with XRE-family HTH domain